VATILFILVWTTSHRAPATDAEVPLLDPRGASHHRASAGKLAAAALATLVGGSISSLCGLGGLTPPFPPFPLSATELEIQFGGDCTPTLRVKHCGVQGPQFMVQHYLLALTHLFVANC